MVLWTWVNKYLFETLLYLLWNMYTNVELLDHMVILFSAFWTTVILFSTVATAFYISISSAQRFQFSHNFTKTCYYCFFYSSHPNGMKQYLIAVLMCISVLTSDVESFVYLLRRNITSDPLRILKWVVSLLLSCRNSLYILDNNLLSDIQFATTFSHCTGCRFTITTVCFDA